jgi:hypothetical protein
MSATTEIRRKYALTKIKRGDYLLPSNDGRTIWRLCAYEDGIEQGLDHDLGTVWGVWKWTGSGTTVDPEDWGAWEMWEGSLRTRAEAIQAALRMGGGHG